MSRKAHKKSKNKAKSKRTRNLSGCHVKLQLSNETIEIFNRLCDSGVTMNNNGLTSQKEIAGGMYVTKITSDSTHILEIHKPSVITGEEEGVDIVVSLYNFHSHPREAYENNNVDLAWPSAQDYIGFLIAVFEDCTVCHLVITIEGIYIISLSKYWAASQDHRDNSVGNFILDRYEGYDAAANIQTPQQYVTWVNNIKYKRNHIFVVKYLPWNRANDTFNVNYCQVDGKCFTDGNNLAEYRKLHPETIIKTHSLQ